MIQGETGLTERLEAIASENSSRCDHGVMFDADAARELSNGWKPESVAAFIMGDPSASAIRKRWPRLNGVCPKGCGFHGIAYASYEHYIAGDW